MNRLAWAGCGVVAAAAWCWSASAGQTYAPDSAAGLGGRELVTHFQDPPTGPTVLTVVDPQTRVLAVYHINRDSGEIALKSVRNFELDLRLTSHNVGGLKPDDIRQSLQLQQTPY
jgi:hypothetical protein